jgi:ATP-dependent DNA helicase RecG
MNRLLQGDVGSGKTVVAAIAMYLAYLNNFQSALMAPTEILAQQHYETIAKLLGPLGVKVGLQTKTSKVTSQLANQLTRKPTNQQTSHIIVGTHALLSEKLEFQRLGLVVIDEQHRFGVEQRTTLRKKGINPHLLTLTATPIPRSVALTLYGELDLSYIDEMPKGRLKIKTWLVPAEKRQAAYEWIKKQLKKDQFFIICPLIEESLVETMLSVRAATTEYQRLQKEIFPKSRLGLLHGRLKSKEKEKVLGDFRQNKLEILVATPVVEVGIDIPNATIMMIETAERFGLAQLHQLRGRVGRREKQSYCLLFSESDKSQNRLKALETIYNGAELAEDRKSTRLNSSH